MMITTTLPSGSRSAAPYSPVHNGAVLAAIVIVASICAWFGQQYDPHIADENHLLEWGQALFLALASGVHAMRARLLPRTSLSFLLHTGLALLMYAFLLRELDIDKFGADHLWKLIERGFRVVEVALWLGFLAYLAPRLKALFAQTRLILSLPVTVLTIVGGLFLVAGWPFDKGVFHSLSHAYTELAEEVLELNGCFILFIAALADSARGLALHRPAA